MRFKVFIIGLGLIGSSGLQAQPIEDYPSVSLSATFARNFHVDKLVAGASIAGRLNQADDATEPMRPIPMLAAEWSGLSERNDFRFTLMGIPVDSKHRLDAVGDSGSGWGWWVLGGVGVAAVAAVAIGAGGGGDNHSQTTGNANCQNGTGIGPASIQNCQ